MNNSTLIARIAATITAACLSCVSLYSQVSANQNYVKKTTVTIPGISVQSQVDALPATGRVQEVNYIDGLGRPLQQVLVQAAPGEKDIITPVQYDVWGREVKKYLPYTDVSGGANGSFRTGMYAAQKNFYSPGNTSVNVVRDNAPYAQSLLEFSPLSRPLEVGAPGESWQLAGGHTTRQVNAIATTEDDVKRWTIGYTPEAIPAVAGVYQTGELFKTIAIDEHGGQQVTYTDREGKTLLKKQRLSTSANNAYTGWLCTYYIYDDFNNLRCVVQPRGVELLIENNWNLAALGNLLPEEQCFRYEYDQRNRMIAKKVPGAGWVYMVYDKRDRFVFNQDANMRGRGQWLATLYDDLNRPVQTGMLIYPGSRADLQAYVSGAGSADATSNYSGVTAGTPANLYVSSHDGRPVYYATQNIFFEGELEGEELETELIAPDGKAFTSIQSFNNNPLPAGYNYIPLTFTYYDNYAWTQKAYNATYNNKLGAGNNSYADPVPATEARMVTGQVTGTRTRVLENPNDLNQGAWLEAVNFYDEKGRVIQVQSDNYKGGEDIVVSRYDFTGKVVSSYQVHNNRSGNITAHRIYTETDYDPMGRVTEVRKTLNDNPATQRVLAHNSYDVLGQLQNRQLGQQTGDDGNTIAGAYLETQDYTYNIRGWQKGLNWQTGTANGGKTNAIAERWFAMDLCYDWGYDKNQYNGNIAAMRWQSKGDGKERSYGYDYDAVNRLLLADFKQYDNGWNNTAGLDFTVKMGDGTAGSAYDANGNIKQMQQWGLIPGGASDQIDNLIYSYMEDNKSNKLRDVRDLVTTDHSLGDFVDKNTDATDYDYDANGNLIRDKNKRINTEDSDPAGAILYNHLNLPWQITVKNEDGSIKGTITYIYDATGNKLEKRVEELPTASNNQKSKHTYTAYLAGHIYENNILQFLGHEEGRVRPQRNTEGVATGLYYYDYFLKDHLGNVRMVLTDEHQTDTYPVASLEAATLNNEKIYYEIPDGGRVLSSSIPQSPFASDPNNAYVQVLNGNGQKMGTAIVLKVMSGDKVTIDADSWYADAAVPGSQSALGVPDIIAALAGGIAGTGAGSHSAALLQQNQGLQSGLGSFLTNVVNADYAANGNNKPKAYLNYVLFDDQFNVVITNDGGNSGVDAVGDAGQMKAHKVEGRPMTRNGYLYIYVSNETPGLNVIFDNLKVTHIRGALMEETHYYPFGLMMKGISSKAEGKLQNRLKYNGKELQSEEFSDGGGLEWYDYGARMQDPKIGRWLTIDLLASKMKRYSPYTFAFNNPIRFVDEDGMAPTDIIISGSVAFQTATFNDLQKLSNVPLVLLEGGRVIEANNSSPFNKPISVGTVEKIPGTNLPANKPVGTDLVVSLINDDNKVTIKEAGNSTFRDGSATPSDNVTVGYGSKISNPDSGGGDSDIGYNPSSSGDYIVNTDGTTGRPAQVGLAHELGHAQSNATGANDPTPVPGVKDPDSKTIGRLSVEEIKVRTKIDNPIRGEQNAKLRATPVN